MQSTLLIVSVIWVEEEAKEERFVLSIIISKS
jgi:hypothetical protein